MKNKKGATLVGSLVAIFILTTTFVSLLNLQADIERFKFFIKNDNTANLLASEGLEIVRSIYVSNNTVFDGLVANSKYKFSLDYTNTTIPNASNSSCTEALVDNSCDLELPIGADGYKMSTNPKNKTFYRFIEISVDGDIISVNSTVVVKNSRFSTNKVYKIDTKLYKIN